MLQEDAMTLDISGSWRQVGGGMRYALDEPHIARETRAALANDPALADSFSSDVIVERHGRRLVAYEWPGRRDGQPPPWDAIRAALR